MISLDGREYLIPIWPIAIPSSTPIVSNSKGIAPASRMASFAMSANSLRCTCPGTISIYELQIATNGLFISVGFSNAPVACKRLLAGAC